MALSVNSTHMYSMENAIEHHTDRFEMLQASSTAIFRRGQPFYFGIRFQRPIDVNKDVVRAVFVTGPAPSPTKGTSAALIISSKANLADDKWDARFITITGNTVTVQVQIPSYAPVAVWKIVLHTARRGAAGVNQHEVQSQVYILFNPWCKNDSVHMNDEDELEEYVLNDNGKVWQGTFKEPRGYQWFYGQFQAAVLPSVMMLLDRAAVPHSERGSPVKMSRCISAITNNVDDNGLIEGRWDGSFDDGTSPFAWIGSTPIFEEFYNTQQPVKYGQCWVFSGVIVTICRALGIPCRSVTNYMSAHDTNSSLTIDTYIDAKGEKLGNHPGSYTNDSCWNFHVWNDVWMDRPDLPKGYGGWQAIDGTPQETSDSMYRCGPAPLEAVRKGEVNIGYDTPFVYTEVRADMCVFKESSEGYWARVKTIPNYVGKLIVTKKIGQEILDGLEDMEDITEIYKNPIDSPEDKMAVKKAIKMVPIAQRIYEMEDPKIEDVEFKLFDIEQITIGESFKIAISVHNTSMETRSISIVLTASSILYTGTTVDRLMRKQVKITLKPNQRENLHTFVKPEEYLDRLSAHSLIRITALANVDGTEQLWSQDDDFTVHKPELTVTLSDQPKVNIPCTARFSFNNPLPIPLTNCTFSIEGPSIHKIIKFRDVNPNEKNVTYAELFKPEKNGEHTVTVSFNSVELNDIKKTSTATVLP
ncbi:hemocyte protein-glutamine gamma-glutamyltransferase-like [Adelges cooleyi]|uniref:hemocyte protein-glutamine gamma-glutamyltransferase-like n=1 Tax=Adelges cooleyi TaxID=133065 RepID=UPI0021806724|nr:hemocyte protein-glutamine gamma-glutamyltransferase-like [Adelges cooleyi]XP_050439554.1 hemocyte protein-glutamine gamma-glutamyltransferase-like [Adelges cooleyi]